MKTIATIAAITLLILIKTCSSKADNPSSMENSSSSSSSMEITGTIEAMQMTTWQYGTHTLKNDTDFYALRSGDVDLSQYEGQTVTVTGNKIEGYPVDGGPEFLEVTAVKE